MVKEIKVMKKKKFDRSSSQKSIKNKCRVCLKEKGDIPIFNNSTQPNISDDIQTFSGVVIDRSDEFSKHICQSCMDLLNGCILFRYMCQQTNKKIIDYKEVKQEFIEYNETAKKEIKGDKKEIDNEADTYCNPPSPNINWDSWLFCPTCKEFVEVKSFKKHISKCSTQQNHDVEPPDKKDKLKFLCDVCGKIFCSSANLSSHKSTHENIFPFICDVCPYQGRTMDLLKVHKRSHLSDKPFKCTQCPKATTTSSNLAKHMRHVHSTNRPHKCSYCEKAFSYQHDMKRHVKDTHLRQGTVECNVCYKKFNTKKILQGHRLKIHKIKGERQGRVPSYLLCQGTKNMGMKKTAS